jgi:hypothetical protein
MLAEGEPVVPVVGAEVSFYLGRKVNEQVAAGIWIEACPENEMQNVEKYFEEAPELPVELPVEPLMSPASVLAQATKNLSLIEIVRRNRRREGSLK